MTALRWLDRNFERYIVGLLLAAIVLLISVNVFMRYVLNDSLSWGEELTLWLFVWFVWVAVSYAFQQGSHVRITFLRDAMGPAGQRAFEVVVDLLVIGFLAVLVVQCLQLMLKPFVLSQTSVVLGLPIPVLYASAPVGATLSILRMTQHLVQTLRGTAAPTEGA
ncbi:MAG: TRAP transporter small permease [Rhodobacteraceae bacterium]|nr:MAG: TRAP transporter small permease [Paracoccaceae bacterium]